MRKKNKNKNKRKEKTHEYVVLVLGTKPVHVSLSSKVLALVPFKNDSSIFRERACNNKKKNKNEG